MKSFLLACCLTVSGAAFAQQSASVSGRIAQPTQDSIKISYYINLVDFKRHTTTVPVAENGAFSMSVPLKQPTAAFMEYNYDIIELFLQPGDQLEVKFNTQDLEKTLKFKGKGAAENNCLAKLNLNFQDDEDFDYSDKNIYTNDGAYLKLVEEKFAVQEKFVEKYMKKQPVSDPFRNWIRTELQYEAGLQKLNYPAIRAAAAKIANPYEVSRNYYSFIRDLEINDNQKLNSLCYINYVQELMQHEQDKINRDNSKPGYYKAFYERAKTTLNPEQKAIVCGRIVIEAFRKGRLKDADKILADYRKMAGNGLYLASVEEAAKYHRHLAVGTPAPELPMRAADGKKIALSDLKGKVTCVYFYNMGCGSCLTEMPIARDLADKFDNDVAFVFVAVDSDAEAWKKTGQRRPWPGVNGLTLNPEAAKASYRLTKFPAVIILDPAGNIYDKTSQRLGAEELIPNLKAALADNSYKDEAIEPQAEPQINTVSGIVPNSVTVH